MAGEQQPIERDPKVGRTRTPSRRRAAGLRRHGSRARQKQRKQALLALLIGLALFGLLHLYQRTGGPPPYFVTGDREPIDLWAIQLDESDAIRDISGTALPGRLVDLGTSSWDRDQCHRTFIFTLGQGAEPVQMAMSARHDIVEAGTGQPLGGSRFGRWGSVDGRPAYLLAATLPAERTVRGFLGLFDSREPIHRVNIDLHYLPAEPQPPELTFEGPLLPGRAIPAAEDPNWVVTAQTDFVDDARFVLTTPRYREGLVLAYDQQGRRWMARSGSGSSRSAGRARLEYTVPDVPGVQLARITIGEPLRTREFHNVPLRFAGRPIPPSPPYLDRLAERMGWEKLSDEELRRKGFETVDQALLAIDVVRGEHLLKVWRVLRWKLNRQSAGELSAEDRDRIRGALQQWRQALVPKTRLAGAAVGVMLGMDEFTEPLLAMLASPDGEIAGEAARVIRAHLADRLTEKQLHAIAEALVEARQPAINKHILYMFRTSRSPEMIPALRRLARAEPPWLWWPALEALGQAQRVREPNDVPPELVARLAVAWPSAVPEGHPAGEEAVGLMLEMLSPEFARHDPQRFLSVVDRLGEQLEADPWQTVTVEALRRLPVGTVSDWLIGYLVKRLNAATGADVGGLSAFAETDPPAMNAYQQLGLVEAAAYWQRTGQDITDWPVGTPGPRDLRIHWRSLDPNTPDAALRWHAPPRQDGRPTTRVMRRGDDFVLLTIRTEGTRRRPIYHVAVRSGVYQSTRQDQLVRLDGDHLPAEVELHPKLQDRWRLTLDRSDGDGDGWGGGESADPHPAGLPAGM
jgi:hypothetical protein